MRAVRRASKKMRAQAHGTSTEDRGRSRGAAPGPRSLFFSAIVVAGAAAFAETKSAIAMACWETRTIPKKKSKETIKADSEKKRNYLNLAPT